VNAPAKLYHRATPPFGYNLVKETLSPTRCQGPYTEARLPKYRGFETRARLPGLTVDHFEDGASAPCHRREGAGNPGVVDLLLAKNWAHRSYELGPASKLALSTSSEAFLRYLAMLSSGSASAFSAPQLLTMSEGGTLGLTGYSLLAVA
jgi:hypothetical protein